MARITTHRGSAQDTHNYYLADYYDAGPEFTGHWLGKGAERLGLRGHVDSKQFMRLLENQHPHTGERLSARNRANRRNGWDVMFSVPKSVSITFGINDDRDIVAALRDATNETLLEMEQDVMQRVNTAPGKQHHAKTGNFISAVWIHPDARAVNGQVPDMQLHAHAFISNHTFSESANRWLAADISNLFRDAQTYYEGAFQNRLAKRLQALGYDIERTANDFEITGVSRELIEKFSKRSAQIQEQINAGYAEELAAKHGVSLTDAKGMVGALTRDAKDKSYTFDELQQHWQSQLTAEERNQLGLVQESKGQPSKVLHSCTTAKEAVDYALEHSFEKEAAVRERKVLADAILYGIEANDVASIRAELDRRELIRQGTDESAILTTKALQDEERAILEFAKTGRGSAKPLAAKHRIAREWLSDEQQSAVRELLSSPDRLQVIRGAAGVGKTTSMQEAVEAIENAGKHVAVMAPGTEAAYDVLRDKDGFDATTIAAFLHDEERQKQVQDGVIWIDEAGLVGSPTMLAVLKIAKAKNARVILGGDTFQHTPVERGHPMRLIAEKSGIKVKEMSQIRRQAGGYKVAVGHLSRHEIEKGFLGLDDLGYVHEIDDDHRDDALAKAYVDATDQYEQEDLLVIAPTHAERRKITSVIRSQLKEKGIIRGEEQTFTTLISKQLSKAERQDPLQYQPGDVVAFHGFGKGGIRPGSQFTISEIRGGHVMAQGFGEIPLSSAGSFSVFRPENARFARGDLIRLTRGRRENGEQKKLTNGSVHRIKSINRGTITLDSGQKLRQDFRFFDHGIAITSHASQGTTVQRAFVAQSSLSFPASSPEQMYVSASRAKQRVDIFTDSRDGLLHAIQRHRPKPFAMDVKPDRRARQQIIHGWNRIKQLAHKFATNQLKWFHDWLPGHVMQPQLER